MRSYGNPINLQEFLVFLFSHLQSTGKTYLTHIKIHAFIFLKKLMYI